MKTNSIVSLLAIAAFAMPAFAQPAKDDKKQPATVPATKINTPAPAEKKDDKKAEVTLKVGSDAPAITANTWVQGTEVKKFEKGKVYVVEFWATWCGPCIKNIPHLTELQKEYKDVAFIGVAASEHEKDAKANQDKVEKFVKEKGDDMGYRVAFSGDGNMSKNWMQAAGQNGIPCAFIVDGEGKVAFIGHPAGDDFSKKLAELAGGDTKKTDKPHNEKPAPTKPEKPTKK